MINLTPIIIAILGAGAFAIICALALHIWADWPREPKLKGIWRNKPLEDWRQND